MHPLLQKLVEGDLRSKGRSEEVVQEIGNDPTLFAIVFDGMFEEDPGLRLRSLHVVEQVCRASPEYLQAHAATLLEKLPILEKQVEMQMLLPLLLGYIKSDEHSLAIIWETLEIWLAKFKKTFARVNCLQALADQAHQHPMKREEAIFHIEETMEKGSAAIQARARLLLKKLGKI